MRHEAHVGFVDAHAEGDGGRHHYAILAQEATLVGRARGGVETGVVGQGDDAVLPEHGRGFLHLAARQAIDDAGFVAMALEEIQ